MKCCSHLRLFFQTLAEPVKGLVDIEEEHQRFVRLSIGGRHAVVRVAVLRNQRLPVRDETEHIEQRVLLVR
jgi:hypothetical protein